MARVTVEDCLALIPNRFALTILASRRARMLGEGRGHALVDCENKEGVTALREIGRSRVRYREDVDEIMRGFIEEQRRQLRVTTGETTFLEAASLRAMEDDEEAEIEEETEDLDELPTDPEALGKKAKVPVSGDEDETDTEEREPAEESEDFDAEAEFSDEEDDLDADIPDEIGEGDDEAADEPDDVD